MKSKFIVFLLLIFPALLLARTGIETGYNPYIDKGVPKSLESFGSGHSCKAINEKIHVPSQIYTIAPLGKAKDVYCDMNTFGGGWTLIYSFGTYPVSRNALVAGGIKTLKDIEKAGLKYNLTHINLKKYGIESDSVQIFSSGKENGFIEFKVPDFAKEIRIDANTRRYDGLVNILKNDHMIFSINKNTPKSPVFLSAFPGDSIKIQEDGVLWLSSIWAR